MKPTDVIDVQFDLMRWWGTPTGRQFGVAFAAVGEDVPNDHPKAVKWGLGLAQREEALLFKADTYWVAAHMVDLLEQVVEDLEPAPLDREQLPTPYGFVWFERPVTFIDIRGKSSPLRALRWGLGVRSDDPSWRPVGITNGLSLAYYAGATDADAYVSVEELHKIRDEKRAQGFVLPSLDLAFVQPWEFGERRDNPGVKGWRTGPTGRPVDLAGGEVEFDVAVESRARMLAVPEALWALLQQTLVEVRPERPSRPQRRRYSGLLTDSALEGVRVVTLRRRRVKRGASESEGEPGGVNWSHQWIVSPHFRWQPYTAGYGEDHRCTHCGAPGVQHKRILIEAHPKGPPDKPLVRKHNVFKVSR